MNYGDKLVFKENKDILEITGVFPSSQGFRIESGEKFLSVSMGGQIAYMPESLVNALMVKYEPKTSVPIVVNTVEEIIKKTVEKKVKTKKK